MNFQDDEDEASEHVAEVFGPWEPPILDHFSASRLKIKRAKEHIENINRVISDFFNSNFYAVSIEKNETGANLLRFDIDKIPFPFHGSALVIGDALHNLRSALDILYYGIVTHPSNWTRFPIRDTREELVATIQAALKKKQISGSVHDLILDGIKPYSAGNYTLWALHDLNIRDKHQLLIPVLNIIRFDGVCLEDDKHLPVNTRKPYLMDASSRFRLPSDMNITVKDKGHATATILFDFGMPFQTQAVVPALLGVAEEVNRTLEAFELLSGRRL